MMAICDDLPDGVRERCLADVAAPQPMPEAVRAERPNAAKPFDYPEPLPRRPIGVCQPDPSVLWKVFNAARVLASPIVDGATKAQRDARCNECKFVVRDGTKRYCGCCGCPQWRFADLDVKNSHSAWSCPKDPAEFGEQK